MQHFSSINKGFSRTFIPGRLTIGVVIPIENYAYQSIPTMHHHLERVQLVERLGFTALWVRDVPFQVPSFGDAGQTYDPLTYLGYLAAHTTTITLGVSSIALPLHHPVHIAKSAATVDQLSQGRLILGIASGDRPEEYPAMGIDYRQRGERFREAVHYLRCAQQDYPQLTTRHYGNLPGSVDIIPKANGSRIPLMITGGSQQTLAWNAKHGDGWMTYPRSITAQKEVVHRWQTCVAEHQKSAKPFMQPLYIDLQKDDDFPPQSIHLGIRTGINALHDYLQQLEAIGVNHVALNLRFNNQAIEDTLEKISTTLLPRFHDCE